MNRKKLNEIVDKLMLIDRLTKNDEIGEITNEIIEILDSTLPKRKDRIICKNCDFEYDYEKGNRKNTRKYCKNCYCLLKGNGYI